MHFIEHFKQFCVHQPASNGQRLHLDWPGDNPCGKYGCTVLVGFKNFKLWELPLENNEFP